MYWRRFVVAIYRPKPTDGFRPRHVQYRPVGFCYKDDYPNLPAVYQGLCTPNQAPAVRKGDLVVFEDRELEKKMVFEVDAKGALVCSQASDPTWRLSCTM